VKILHTSDWHLGHRLHEQSQLQEQELFLIWLKNHIENNNIDVLLVSGDIFDVGVPSSQSQELYYNFLIRLKQSNCKHVIVIGGNHDAPSTLNAPKELLKFLSIHVVGKATADIKDEVFELSIDNQSLIIAAVPYLRDQDIRRAVAGESFDQIGDRYKKALLNHYNEVAHYCQSIKQADSTVIAMGHLFANGGKTSSSEQTIYVGNLGDIGADDFPEIFDYVALGHLHRAQKVGKQKHIRYSGSPYVLSFSEVGSTKSITVLDVKKAKPLAIQKIEIPHFRAMHQIYGKHEDCIQQLHDIDNQHHELCAWVAIELDNQNNTTIGYSEIQKAAAEMDLEVLKVTLKTQRKSTGIETSTAINDIKSLTPIDVFKMKCSETEYDLEENPEILDAFKEIVQIVKKG